MEDIAKEKIKTRDILVEVDNLKKYVDQIANNVRSEKLESFINTMDKNIAILQTETENFYNENYDKVVNSDNNTTNNE